MSRANDERKEFQVSPRLLTQQQTEVYLNLSRDTLIKYRHELHPIQMGEGSALRYDIRELDAFIERYKQ